MSIQRERVARLARGNQTARNARLPVFPRQGYPLPAIARCACGGSCPRCQAKSSLPGALRISQPGDSLEREADAAADHVMRMAEPAAIGPAPVAIQRKCAQCEDQEEPLIQAKADHSANSAPLLNAGTAARVAKRSGSPLPTDVRSFFEPRFGRDFSRVRVHTGSEAAEGAHAVQARAFTMGSDIVFGAGEYAPGTTAGQRLLAHELTHVVQQTGLRGSSSLGNFLVQRQQNPNLLLDSSPEFPGCSPYERFRLDIQISHAQAMVANARREVADELARTDRASGTISQAGSAITRYFKTDATRHVRRLLSILEQIQNRLARGPRNWKCLGVRACHDQCGIALACAEPSRINICPDHFFRDDTRGALTLVHEAGHQAGIGVANVRQVGMGFSSEYYRDDSDFAGLRTGQALDNPDSVMSLVGELMYGRSFNFDGRPVWSAMQMWIEGAIREPDIGGDHLVGRLFRTISNPPQHPEVAGFPRRTVLVNRFAGQFIFHSALDANGPERPALLRDPQVSLRIALHRTGSAAVRAGRAVESVLFDRAEVATADKNSQFVPASGLTAYAFDFNFDPADQGTLSIVAELDDPDTATTLDYRDSLPVRPPANTTGLASPGNAGGGVIQRQPTTEGDQANNKTVRSILARDATFRIEKPPPVKRGECEVQFKRGESLSEADWRCLQERGMTDDQIFFLNLEQENYRMEQFFAGEGGLPIYPLHEQVHRAMRFSNAVLFEVLLRITADEITLQKTIADYAAAGYGDLLKDFFRSGRLHATDLDESLLTLLPFFPRHEQVRRALSFEPAVLQKVLVRVSKDNLTLETTIHDYENAGYGDMLEAVRSRLSGSNLDKAMNRLRRGTRQWGCYPGEHEMLKETTSSARSMAKKAARLIDADVRAGIVSAPIRAAFEKHFNPGGAPYPLDFKTLLRIRIVLLSAYEEMSQPVVFKCVLESDSNYKDSPCLKKAAGAFTGEAPRSSVAICPAFWTMADDWKAKALLHEFVHHFHKNNDPKDVSITDRGYELEKRYSKLIPQTRATDTDSLSNADSYANFASDLWLQAP